MKIGILTHHYVNNFGAFLQAYALQTALQELFPNDDVLIIDCINIKHFIVNVGGWFRFYKRKETLKSWIQKIHLPITFGKARKRYMHLTHICYNAKGVEKLGMDYVIVGSDEVWNYKEAKGNAKVKFGIGLNHEKLIAYAPSVGQTHDDNVPAYVIEGILKFKAVSARDQLTAELAQKIRHEKIERVVDPTFLTHIPDEQVPGVTQPFMLFYYCDGLDELEKNKLATFAYQNGMKVYGAGENDKIYSGITVNLTPFQWVWMFRNANYVITGTFHGAVFSMQNHRQFACYLTNPSRIRKVTSLLEEFGLTDRRTSNNADEIIKTLKRKIDYTKLETKFEDKKNISKEFLRNAIQ